MPVIVLARASSHLCRACLLWARVVLFKFLNNELACGERKKEKTDNPREGWEDGTPPPHRDFKERGVLPSLPWVLRFLSC